MSKKFNYHIFNQITETMDKHQKAAMLVDVSWLDNDEYKYELIAAFGWLLKCRTLVLDKDAFQTGDLKHKFEQVKMTFGINLHYINCTPLTDREQEHLKENFPLLANVLILSQGKNELSEYQLASLKAGPEMNWHDYIEQLKAFLLAISDSYPNNSEHVFHELTFKNEEFQARVLDELFDYVDFFSQYSISACLKPSFALSNPNYIASLFEEDNLKLINWLNTPIEGYVGVGEKNFFFDKLEQRFSQGVKSGSAPLYITYLTDLANKVSELPKINPDLCCLLHTVLSCRELREYRIQSKFVLNIPLDNAWYEQINGILLKDKDYTNFLSKINIAYYELGLTPPFKDLNLPGLDDILLDAGGFLNQTIFGTNIWDNEYLTMKNVWAQMSKLAQNNFCNDFVMMAAGLLAKFDGTSFTNWNKLGYGLENKMSFHATIPYYSQLILDTPDCCLNKLPEKMINDLLFVSATALPKVQHHWDKFLDLLKVLKTRKCALSEIIQKYLVLTLPQQRYVVLNFLYDYDSENESDIETLQTLFASSVIEESKCQKLDLSTSKAKEDKYLLTCLNVWMLGDKTIKGVIVKALKEINNE